MAAWAPAPARAMPTGSRTFRSLNRWLETEGRSVGDPVGQAILRRRSAPTLAFTGRLPARDPVPDVDTLTLREAPI